MGKRIYKFNEDFFGTWSQSMAYVLGAWWADGCIHKLRFNITTHVDDVEWLNMILVEMDSSHRVYYNRSTCFIQISSRKLVSDIKKLGGVERKSLCARMPEVPEHFMPDFIRGLWDGDGTICYIKTAKGSRSALASGSEAFLHQVKNALSGVCLGGSVQVDRRKGTTCQLNYGINDTIRLREYMYSDAKLYLSRKRERFYDAGSIRQYGKGKTFLPFEDARAIIRNMKIKNCKEWERCDKPSGVPSHPNRTYKEEWKGYKDWFGNEDARKA